MRTRRSRSPAAPSPGTKPDDDGGAIQVDYYEGVVTLNSSTITDNDAYDDGGGIFNDYGGTVNLLNTIIANNDSEDCYGDFNSNGYNLDSDDTCDLDQLTDLYDADADLADLANNGGYTETHLPGGNSDAIDNGDPNCPALDQRGLPRPSGAGCDIGAVELQTAAQYPLCVNPYTGQLRSPVNGGGCLGSETELLVPDDYPMSFCINPYTGAVSYLSGANCPPRAQLHVVPDDGNLFTCVNRYTGANRRVETYGECRPNEVPNIVPAEAVVPV